MYSLECYLFQSCVCVVALYIPYVLLLRHTTFFALNRCYLAGGLLLSAILPAIILKPNYAYALPSYQFMEEIAPIMTRATSTVIDTGVSWSSINYVSILAMLYGTGVVYCFLRSIIAIARIIKLKSAGESLM